MNAGFKIKRRDDLIPGCVALKFLVNVSTDGNAYTQVIHDIAGTIGGTVYEGIGLAGALYTLASFAGGTPTLLGSGNITTLQDAARDFAAVSATINFQGNQSTSARCIIGTIGVNLADFSANGFWQHLFPEFKTMTTAPSIYNNGTGPAPITCLVENPGNANTSIPNDQTDIVAGGQLASTYTYVLTDGQVAPWMLNGNLPTGAKVSVLQATLKAYFSTTSTTVVGSATPTLRVSPYVEKTARVTLLSIAGGLYQTQTSYAPGEVLPYGLAGYIYRIGLITQYEGAFQIQEQEITDLCPLGNNLNLAGGLAEWAGMAACVQNISYDLAAGKTSLTFGPAAHLGAKDLVERLRQNRYPIRPYYGTGGNVQNDPNSQAGTQLGNSVAQRGPTLGAENAAFQVFPPPSLTDIGANAAAYLNSGGTGAPGVTVDSRTSGQPNYGNIAGLSAPNAGTILLAAGSGGTLSKCIRISVADLVGTNKQAWFQPMSLCVNVSGTPTTKTIYVLCTAPE